MASHQSTYRMAQGDRAASNAWASGIILFASVFMVIGGTFQAIQGLAAVLNDDFFENVNNYAYDLDVTSWGWMHLIVGAAVGLTGLALLSGAIWARILALFIVVASAILNFVYIPYQPLWSLILLVIDGAIIWALITFEVPDETGTAP